MMILTGSDNVLPKDWYNCVFTAVQVSIGAQTAAITLTDRGDGGGGGGGGGGGRGGLKRVV